MTFEIDFDMNLTWKQMTGIFMIVALFAGMFGMMWASMGFLNAVAVCALIDLLVAFIFIAVFLVME